ncbi:hypothetical protein MIR68_000791 [Amoeboaphelidium protococcarum]|nr:hypothetical protein MIR68_000791 [Amoeboaphelidium protococcarum]
MIANIKVQNQAAVGLEVGMFLVAVALCAWSLRLSSLRQFKQWFYNLRILFTSIVLITAILRLVKECQFDGSWASYIQYQDYWVAAEFLYILNILFYQTAVFVLFNQWQIPGYQRINLLNIFLWIPLTCFNLLYLTMLIVQSRSYSYPEYYLITRYYWLYFFIFMGLYDAFSRVYAATSLYFRFTSGSYEYDSNARTTVIQYVKTVIAVAVLYNVPGLIILLFVWPGSSYMTDDITSDVNAVINLQTRIAAVDFIVVFCFTGSQFLVQQLFLMNDYVNSFKNGLGTKRVMGT